MHLRTLAIALVIGVFVSCSHAQDKSTGLPDGVKNTQRASDKPLSPKEALAKIRLPKGFRVSLFAGEPDVAQPVSLCLDDRGRLWVGEYYSYRHWAEKGNDRVLVFEDTDGDGEFDSRRVFWDKGNYLTSIQVGFGGVFVASAPNLLFIPDRDGDLVPDGEAEVVLDGWGHRGVHTQISSLIWGPDGWLYGGNGINSPSSIGKPGTPPKERVKMNCGIWRYHPSRGDFEVVAHGTTNPWGLDFDMYGQGFLTNCVIGHLFHLIPGARYERMHGKHFNPHTYHRIDAHSDHLHWGGGKWTSSRGGEGVHDKPGGGHAHCGGMIYLGDNWPEEYRGDIYMCNIHGNRVNRDHLERNGSGYAGLHGKDFLFANDPWFRGTVLKYGPDGGVFVADWTDFGECHDSDGIHRTSGRVYKVTWGKTEPYRGDVSQATEAELVDMQTHANAWFARHGRRVLQERRAKGESLKVAIKNAKALLRSKVATEHRLRALWTLHVCEPPDLKASLLGLLEDQDEYLRAWAVRLLVDQPTEAKDVIAAFNTMSAGENSSFVRLHLASAMQRIPIVDRWTLAENLSSHADDAADVNVPPMVWYGIEPAISSDRARALKLVKSTKFPMLRKFIARRLVAK